MTETTSAAAAAAARTTHTAHIGGDAVTIQRPNGAKASRVFAELRQAGGATEAVTTAWGEFVRSYEASNVVELDRVQARFRYPPRPILDPETRQPVRDDNGDLVYQPSVVDAMSEADWAAAGGVLRLPKSPDTGEVIAHVAPIALEHAEDRVYRILALFLMSNDDVARYRRNGELDQALNERVDELLDKAYADELLELAVVCGETVDHHFRRKVSELGDRVGNALRLVGMGPKTPTSPTTPTPEPSSVTPSSSTSTSSTGSPASTDGRQTSPSAPPSTSSAPAVPASTPTVLPPSKQGSSA
jgi:hypothetical protein